MTELLLSQPALARTTWPRVVVCGVDGRGESREAVRQAAALAGADGRLALHMVTRGNGFAEDPASVLADAQRVARTAGVNAETHAAPAATAAAGLLGAAASADLLVVGCDALGPTPKAVLRHARGSVLLARRAPGLPLLDTIMVGEDSPPRILRVAAQLAEAHGSELRMVPDAKLPLAAAAIGAGLIVAGDGPGAIPLARVAPCSVLIVRAAA
jgi:nucleotide-binding universal stress UspA family protein